jgi:hypothetical protein
MEFPGDALRIVLLWVFVSVGGLGLSLLMGYITYLRSRKEWATRPGEKIPVPKKRIRAPVEVIDLSSLLFSFFFFLFFFFFFFYVVVVKNEIEIITVINEYYNNK